MYTMPDKAILVTGSTRGIGRAIAEALHTSGATVGIHGRKAETVAAICAELSDAGERTIPIVGDFTDPELAASAVQEFTKAAGRIDGLVNNAGGGKAIAFRGVTLEKWRSTFAVNLEAALRASQEAYLAMRKQKSGSIVNIASLAAHGPGRWMGADYAASKAGLVSLTKSLALESARFGIRVNAVSPGMVETDMTSVMTEEQQASVPIPMGRFGTPPEIAETVAFLLSDHSSYMTGQVLHVDGGLFM